MGFPILAGLVALLLHVVSGPDRLAAITPLSIEIRQKVWKVGLVWGFGHFLKVLIRLLVGYYQ
ncbi:hypothetical protein KIM67_17230 [Flagellimonas sp. 389]|uniref:hypothetical protein n=1 Tax=Flagellimonas sp. 389 TaxID=2835862 RepID=UPI001BD6A5B0|nr:hypothetical protein [Flagellimonas sp. 389]MBS9464169.1 hypothetical protein [Flagellimonas sp. 389]